LRLKPSVRNKKPFPLKVDVSKARLWRVIGQVLLENGLSKSSRANHPAEIISNYKLEINACQALFFLRDPCYMLSSKNFLPGTV
jgi:hypothetical protein